MAVLLTVFLLPHALSYSFTLVIKSSTLSYGPAFNIVGIAVAPTPFILVIPYAILPCVGL